MHVPIQGQSAAVLVQPLTEREREVLGHLDALLPTRQIAAEMFVSVNTVKTHVRAILRKLSAKRRHEAVRRARELRACRAEPARVVLLDLTAACCCAGMPDPEGRA